MKFFTNRRLWQKMLIVILGIIMISFVCARPVHADWLTDVAGILFQPVMQFLVGIGDTLIDFLQDSVLGLGEAFLTIDRGNEFWSIVIAFVSAIIAVALVVICFIPRTTSSWMGSSWSCNKNDCHSNNYWSSSRIWCEIYCL